MAAPPVLAALVAAGIDAPAWATVTAVVLGALAAAALTLHFVVRPLGHLVATARLDAADLGAATEHLRGLLEVRDRFEAAAVAVDAEPTLLRLAVRAVHEIVQDHDVALLLSLPEEHRVAWRVRSLDGELLPAEPAPSRPGCTALATERTAIADSIHRLGACEHLQGPDADDVSAVCIPLRLGDRSLGSVCVTGPPGEVPSADDVAALEHLVTTTGRRLGELRHRHGPSTPGPTDPVTGLPGEAALRSRAGELVRSQIPYCVAILRIDGAADFREENGADAWNDALRLLGDTTGTTLRPDDVVCRLDQDRIAAVLAKCSTAQAAAALERVRESLVLALTVAGVPYFTCSAGLVDGARGTSTDDTVRMADAAGETALLQGGNRVVVADAATA